MFRVIQKIKFDEVKTVKFEIIQNHQLVSDIERSNISGDGYVKK